MFSCSLCREQCQEYVFVQSHCSECCEIRRIISLYNRKDVLDTLRWVYLRDEQDKRSNRTKFEAELKEKTSDIKANKEEVAINCLNNKGVITRSKAVCPPQKIH